ncbi:MAG: hypothetical protein AB7I18_14810 [Candidatus Berkiella sp.]
MLGFKKRRKRKNQDKAWHPRQNAGARDLSSFSTENLLRFMQAASSPASKMAVINSSRTAVVEGETKLSTPTGKHSSQLLSPSKYQASTPEAGPKTTHLVTPKGTKLIRSRLIELNDGDVSVFLPQNKVIEKSLTIPSSAKPWIEHSPIPAVDMGGMVDIPITKKKLKKVEEITRKRKREGVNPRKISQNDLNGIPATKAMRKSGIAVNDGDGHYAHFIPFSFLGDDAQTVNNMGIGTRYANAAMELVNPAIRRLLYMKNGPETVYLSAIPEWVPGFEKIRLLKNLTYIIKDGKGTDFRRSFKVTFNMLSLKEVCVSEVQPVKNCIVNTFSGKKRLASTPVKPAPGKAILPSPGFVSPQFGTKRPLQESSSRIRESQGSPYSPSYEHYVKKTKFKVPFPDLKNVPITKLTF